MYLYMPWINSGVPMGPLTRITWAASQLISIGPEEAHSWPIFQKSPADNVNFLNYLSVILREWNFCCRGKDERKDS